MRERNATGATNRNRRRKIRKPKEIEWLLWGIPPVILFLWLTTGGWLESFLVTGPTIAIWFFLLGTEREGKTRYE